MLQAKGRWAHLLNKYDKISYRIGVEVENILIEPEGDTIEASTRAEIVKRLLSETKK